MARTCDVCGREVDDDEARVVAVSVPLDDDNLRMLELCPACVEPAARLLDSLELHHSLRSSARGRPGASGARRSSSLPVLMVRRLVGTLVFLAALVALFFLLTWVMSR
jgi:hypothetical protein